VYFFPNTDPRYELLPYAARMEVVVKHASEGALYVVLTDAPTMKRVSSSALSAEGYGTMTGLPG